MSQEQSRPPESKTVHWGKINKGKDEILNVRSEMLAKKTRLLAVIDKAGLILSKPMLFVVLLLFHSIWIALNLPIYPWTPWDPYPFMFLATLASVEAPFIALLILMHQQRNTRIDELRGEILLQVSLHVERQSSMALRVLRELQEGLHISTGQDADLLERMEVFLDTQELLQNVRERMKAAEGIDPAKTA